MIFNIFEVTSKLYFKEKKKRKELISITDVIDKNVKKNYYCEMLWNIFINYKYLINKYNKSRFFLFIYLLMISNFYNQIRIQKIYDIFFYF